MKRPVRYSRQRLRYTGTVDRTAFDRWADSPDGHSVVHTVMSHMRFALFGKRRAARRRVWRDVKDAARSPAVVDTLQREVDTYLAHLERFAYARDLPRAGVELHRLIVVPRVFANAAADRRIDDLLHIEPAFATHEGRTPLRDWFSLAVIDGIESAIIEARPSPVRPLAAGREWLLVGVNDRFEWRVPFKGPAWPGHYFLLELTREPITRAVRKGAAEAMAQLEASLPSLPRLRRDEILKQATESLQQQLVRA